MEPLSSTPHVRTAKTPIEHAATKCSITLITYHLLRITSNESHSKEPAGLHQEGECLLLQVTNVYLGSSWKALQHYLL
jgi:hypothetical protein